MKVLLNDVVIVKKEYNGYYHYELIAGNSTLPYVHNVFEIFPSKNFDVNAVLGKPSSHECDIQCRYNKENKSWKVTCKILN